jgi:hypothetical protein
MTAFIEVEREVGNSDADNLSNGIDRNAAP